MNASVTRPPFDPEIGAALAKEAHVSLRPDMIPGMRGADSGDRGDELASRFGIRHRSVVVPGFRGARILVSIFEGTDSSAARPGILHFHGGGMVMGDRFRGVEGALPWVTEHNAVVVSVEYRLAPEYPDPIPLEDCYAALSWLAGNAANLGVDTERLVLTGGSAGGGLAAGVALLARDRDGPPLLGMLLVSPMLDDRDQTISSQQFDGVGRWDRASNRTAWSCLLGDRRGTDDVSLYSAPARAEHLSGLPPTYLDVGSAEVLRDENVAFANLIWASGGVAELHVWPGGTHAFFVLAPEAAISVLAVAARDAWLARLLTA